MRYWDKAVDPDSRTAHSHGRTTAPINGQFGQRPMFSPSNEEQEPAENLLPSEARLEDLKPIDESSGSKARAKLRREETSSDIMLPFSTDNVNYPPTKAQIVAAFGPKPVGWTGFIIDGGGAGVVWLCIRSLGDCWYRILATKAT